MRILCAGISHKTAPLSIRERFALDAPARRAALKDLCARWPEAECLALSTCNRTEVYLARPAHGRPRADELRDWLASLGGLSGAEPVYVLEDSEAAGHLFAVASGLESLVPGEPQIVAQIKDAYGAAGEAGAARHVLHELVQAALHAAKRVRSETPIGQGKVSVASVAVEQAAEALGSLAGVRVLSVGAGKMSELILRHLRRRGAGDVVVANRSAAAARELAGRCGGRSVPFERLTEALPGRDLVLTSTAADAPVLRRKDIAAGRGDGPLVIIDIAVPRDVEPGAGDLPGVRLYNIDDLEAVAARAMAARRDEAEAGREVIAPLVAEFERSLRVREVAPTIRSLHEYMRAVADAELADAMNKLSTHDDAPEDERILRRALHRTIRRILHPAARNLRDAAGSQSASIRAAALRKAFGLDAGEDPPARPR